MLHFICAFPGHGGVHLGYIVTGCTEQDEVASTAEAREGEQEAGQASSPAAKAAARAEKQAEKEAARLQKEKVTSADTCHICI
jgi:hypothetical protein